MSAAKRRQRIKDFEEFAGLAKELLAEHGEGSWNNFLGHVQDVLQENYVWDDDTIMLNSMYWNSLGTMVGNQDEVTMEAVGGEQGLEQVLTQAQEKAQHAEKVINESLDNRGFFMHQRNGKDALPAERFIEFGKEKGSLVVLGSGGQGFVLYGKLKTMPYETLEQFYGLLISRESEEIQEASRKKTQQVLKGVRAHADKATKMRRLIQDKWKYLFEQSGYVFNPKRHFGDEVAVKVFPAKTLSTVGGFEKESRFIGWPNPHIMPIFAKGSSKSGISIVVMPFVDMSLTVSPVQVSRDFDLEEVIDALAKICTALDQLHKEGMVHRDIKPGNILITREKSFGWPSQEVLRPILTDFGLASVPEYTAYSISNTIKGTPRYLPPEQAIDAKRAKPQSDMFSLSLWGYELLTGETFNPKREDLAALINRLWGLSRGNVYHKPNAPSTFRFNIVRNQVDRGEYHGIFKWFKRRAEQKRLYRMIENLERVLARMVTTQDASGVLDRCSKKTEYKKTLIRKGRVEYVDLQGSGKESDKDRFINKMVEPRYATMADIVTDLELIKSGKDYRGPDYRRQIFSRVKRKHAAHPLLWLTLLAGVATIGIMGLTGYLGKIVDVIKSWF